MQNIDLKIAVSDATLGLIDSLRLTRSREDIVRQLIELGLCEMLEATARTHRETLIHSASRQTEDLAIARNNLLVVKAPKEQATDEQDGSNVRRYETIQTISSRTARS